MLIIWINFCVCNIVFYLHRSDVVVRLTHLLWSFNDSTQDMLLSIYLLFYISFYVYYIFVSYHHHCRISFFELQSRITSLLHRVLCDIYWGITFLLCSFFTQSTIKKEVNTVSHIKALNYFWQKYTNRTYIVTTLLQLTRKELIMLMWYINDF